MRYRAPKITYNVQLLTQITSKTATEKNCRHCKMGKLQPPIAKKDSSEFFFFLNIYYLCVYVYYFMFIICYVCLCMCSCFLVCGYLFMFTHLCLLAYVYFICLFTYVICLCFTWFCVKPRDKHWCVHILVYM